MIGKALGVMAASVALVAPFAGTAQAHETDNPNWQRQRFVIIDTDNDQSTALVAAYGAIHDLGFDQVLGPRRDSFTFDDGGLFIKHRPVRDRRALRPGHLSLPIHRVGHLAGHPGHRRI